MPSIPFTLTLPLLLLALLLAPPPTNASLQHRPISHHPTDTHAVPRFQIRYLNDFPISRGEADGWGRLVGAAGKARGSAIGRRKEEKEDGNEDNVLTLPEQERGKDQTTTTTIFLNNSLEQIFDGSAPTSWDWNHPGLLSRSLPSEILSEGEGEREWTIYGPRSSPRSAISGTIAESESALESVSAELPPGELQPELQEEALHDDDDDDDGHHPLGKDHLPRLIRLLLPASASALPPSTRSSTPSSTRSGPASNPASNSNTGMDIERGISEWLCMIPSRSIVHPPQSPALTVNTSDAAAAGLSPASAGTDRDSKQEMEKELTAARERERAAQIEKEKEKEKEKDPVKESLRALEHLRGGCLFHRAGWFTYAYCHASHVRQFREMSVQDPLRPEGWIPAEDPNHEAYDLGVSPAEIRQRLEYYSDLTNLRGLENDPELELQLAAYEYALSEYHHSQSQSQSHSRSAGSGKGAEDEVGEVDLVQNSQGRYLVQRWSGGTVCDMTGRPRRIEIQFHCRMGGVDEISSIKEIATCQYLMTIHSPHLCSLPGFHIPTIDDEPSRPITCREIRDDIDQHDELTTTGTHSHKGGKNEHGQAQSGHPDSQAFPRGYPVQPHGAQWHAHHQTSQGGRVIYENPTENTAEDDTSPSSSLSPPYVVVDPGPAKKRKSAKAAQADTMDEQSRKSWLAEQRAAKIAMREKLAVVEEEIQRARQELWDARWDVRFVRRFGWVMGVDEAEYREWWEALMDEQEEEIEKEKEGRKMKV